MKSISGFFPKGFGGMDGFVVVLCVGAIFSLDGSPIEGRESSWRDAVGFQCHVIVWREGIGLYCRLPPEKESLSGNRCAETRSIHSSDVVRLRLFEFVCWIALSVDVSKNYFFTFVLSKIMIVASASTFCRQKFAKTCNECTGCCVFCDSNTSRETKNTKDT